jgi:RNA polymerase sigma-70 factor (ECF subfamily)
MIRELRELIAATRTANISRPNSDIQAGGTYGDEEQRLDQVPQLVEKAKRGDRDAFAELYRLHYARIFRMARLHLGDLGDGAEDAVAETFLRAWAALPRYRDTGAPFVAWLFGIARHVVLDEVARGRRVMPREELPERTRGWTVDDGLTLAQAMDRLPTAQRQVVELKYLAGMRNEEVASALGKSKGAINAMQWRALGTLREILEER